MNKKFCVIIDSYPKSEKEQKILFNNLKILKKNNIDVILTSHHPCTTEIIDNTDYFIFEKKNNYHFLDSDILNHNISEIRNRIYMKYLTVGEETFRDYLVITGWSVAITSQIFNAIKFVYGKGYDFAFYFVGDFICPEDINGKIQNVLQNLSEHRNFFIQNKPNFNSWFSGLFFGITVDQQLIDKIPNLDFSENLHYQKFFPNHTAEDVILKIFGDDDNFVADHQELDNFFGTGNWDLMKSSITGKKSLLHASTICSIFLKEDLSESSILLHVDSDCFSEKVKFSIEIGIENSDPFLERQVVLGRGGWYKEKINEIFSLGEDIILTKKIESLDDETCLFSDSIEIKKDFLPSYAFLKNYYHL